MELLDTANTKSFGTPEPRRVHTDIRKGPFIVVSGHDLKDMAELLAQTERTGINVTLRDASGTWLSGACEI